MNHILHNLRDLWAKASVMHCCCTAVLYCTVLYCIVLYCIVCTVLYCTVLYVLLLSMALVVSLYKPTTIHSNLKCLALCGLL